MCDYVCVCSVNMGLPLRVNDVVSSSRALGDDPGPLIVGTERGDSEGGGEKTTGDEVTQRQTGS